MTAIALKLSRSFTARAAAGPTRRASNLRRAVAHRWDLAAVLSLMLSSTAYAVWALSHLA